MKLHSDIGEKPIKEVIDTHPIIGQILEHYEIGCIQCSIGTCLLKDVVSVHFLGADVEKEIEHKINSYLQGQ